MSDTANEFDEGIDFTLLTLCAVLGVDPQSIEFDAATETLDGDVRAVIGNIFTAKFGDGWDPSDWGKAAE